MWKNYLKITWKVLKRKRVYTIVTMIGIVLPVTFIVILTAFFTHLGNNTSPKSKFNKVIYLDNIQWKEIYENGDENMNIGSPPTYSFIQKHLEVLKTPKMVASVSNTFYDDPEIIYINKKPTSVIVKYTDTEFWDLCDFHFLEGRPFNEAEFERKDPLAIIDKKTSILLFGKVKSAGKTFTFKNKNYIIAGVVENVDATMLRIAANIYFPYSCSDQYYNESMWDLGSSALILTARSSDFNKIQGEFQQQLKKVSFDNLGMPGINHVEGNIIKENYIERLILLTQKFFRLYENNTYRLYYIALSIIVLFFVVIPALNLINITINRFYERISEIGVRKAYGASIKTVIVQFLFENTIITFMG